MTKDNGFNNTGVSTQAATQALRALSFLLSDIVPDNFVDKAIDNLEEETGFHFLNKEERGEKLSEDYMDNTIAVATDEADALAQTARIAVIRDRIEWMLDYRFIMRPDMNLAYNVKTGELLLMLIPLKISFDDDDARLGDSTKFYSTEDEWEDDYTQAGSLGIMVTTYPLMQKLHEGDAAALELDELITTKTILHIGEGTSDYVEKPETLIAYKRSKMTMLTNMLNKELKEESK